MATLVTGASSGLGVEFARLAAERKQDLVLVARSTEKLEALAAELRAQSVTVTVVAEDLAETTSVARLMATLAGENIVIDTLINNAGVGKLGAFATMSDDAIAGMIDLNVRTLTLLARSLLPGMLERKNGRILNVASTAAFQPGPLMAVYYATKAYVVSWSLALSNELAGTGITVTCLCPGPTSTGFQKVAGMNRSAMFKSAFLMSAARAASIGYSAMLRGRTLIVAGKRNSVIAFCTRLLPRSLCARIARRMQAPR